MSTYRSLYDFNVWKAFRLTKSGQLLPVAQLCLISAKAQVNRDVMSEIEHVSNGTAVGQSSTFRSTAQNSATLVSLVQYSEIRWVLRHKWPFFASPGSVLPQRTQMSWDYSLILIYTYEWGYSQASFQEKDERSSYISFCIHRSHTFCGYNPSPDTLHPRRQ
jgi:hypothetical protein